MIGIEIIGTREFLDLAPNTRLNLKWVNPIFADDNVIPGSYSLPFSIPFGEKSPKNTRLLKHADVLENTVSKKQVNARLYFDLNKFRTGLLVLGDASKETDTLSVNFKYGGLSALENIKTMKLAEVVDETIELNDNTTYVKTVLLEPKFPASGSFTIKVNGKQFTAASISDLVNAINTDTSEPRAVATYIAGSPDTFTVKPATAQTDINTSFTVDAEPADSSSWIVTPNDEDWNAPIRTALNPYINTPYPNNKFRLPTILNKGQFPEGTAFNIGLINMSTDGALNANFSAPEGDGIVNFNPFVSHIYTDVAPYIMLKHVLDKIADHYGITYQGDFYSHDVVTTGLIYTTKTLGQKIPFIGTSSFIFLKQTFNIGEFVPDLTLADFFKALQKKFNLAIYFNEETNQIAMKFRDTIANAAPVKDITAICGPIKAQGSARITGITLKIEKDESDPLCPNDSITIGNEVELTIPTKCYGLASTTEYFHTLDVMPVVSQETNKGDYKFLRLFFYKGIKTSSNFTSFDYPYAGVNPVGLNIGYVDGATGVYYEKWKSYVRFLLNRKRVAHFQQLELRDLLAVDMESKYTFDRINYLILSLDITLTMRGIEPTRAELYTTGLGVLP